MLECSACGCEAVPSDENGYYHQDDAAWCPECGCAVTINVDGSDDDPEENHASADSDEFRVINVAQPKCNGLCVEGAEQSFLREEPLCRLDCPRVSVTSREIAAERIAAGEKP